MTSITKDVIIADLLNENPEAGDVLVSMGMHCITCPVSRMETVEEAAMVHGVDAEELVGKLNAYFESKKK